MSESAKHEFLPIRLIEDQPMDDLDKDYLGLMPWAKMIAGTAVGTPGPLTIGVHGEWGYGKTTLLKLAKRLIDRNYKHAVTVWFNAWQFEREEHPLFPLIAAIADEIEKKTEDTALDKGKGRLKKIGLSLRALARGMKFKGEVGMPLVGKVGIEFDTDKALEAEDLLGKQTNPLLSEMLYHSAFGVLEEATGPKDAKGKRKKENDEVKIVVFVDDLDRCQPDKAVHLLESIKLILAQPGFIFVLGVDRGVLHDYLEKRYVQLCGEAAKGRGRFYMEKIIQLPILIPRHHSRFAEFVQKTVESLDGQDSIEVQALTNIRDVLATGSGANPRSLVRLVNSFLLDCNLWPLIDHDKKYQKLSQDVAAALAFNRILQHDLDSLYPTLIRDQELCDAILSGDDARLWGFAESSSQEDGGEEGSPKRFFVKEQKDQRSAVAQDLLRRAELLAALREYGDAWLSNQELREVVHEFAQTERTAGVEFSDAVARAIRRALHLDADEPIPSNRLPEVIGLAMFNTSVADADLMQLGSLPGLRDLDLSRTRVTDAGLTHLKNLSGLQEIILWCTQVTDTGLMHLKEVSELNILDLEGTLVTDDGLLHLKNLAGLRYLHLGNTKVTDAGLAHLKGLAGLQYLYLEGTHVTDAGVDALKKASPHLAVFR